MNRDTRRSRLTLALLLLCSLTLVALDYTGGDSSPLQGARTVAGDVFGPVENAAAQVVRPVAAAASALNGTSDDKERIEALQARVDQLQLELNTSGADKARVAELDRVLRILRLSDYTIVPAQVSAIDSSRGIGYTVTIDAGTRDGVRRNMTVINSKGLVGRVVEANAWTATVRLAIDPRAGVGVRVEKTDEYGRLTGGGTGALDLEILGGQTSAGVGDRLVTLGSENASPYVPGVPVGEIVSVDPSPGFPSKHAKVRLFVDFDALDLVSVVVQPPRRDPRDALLPPRDAPTPTSSPAPTPPPARPSSSPRRPSPAVTGG